MDIHAPPHTAARDIKPNDDDGGSFAGTRRVVEEHLARAILAAQHRADRAALGPLPDVKTTHPSPFAARAPEELGRDDGEARRARHAQRVAAMVRAARPTDDDAAGCGKLRA